jgi:hypothetical protein
MVMFGLHMVAWGRCGCNQPPKCISPTHHDALAGAIRPHHADQVLRQGADVDAAPVGLEVWWMWESSTQHERTQRAAAAAMKATGDKALGTPQSVHIHHSCDYMICLRSSSRAWSTQGLSGCPDRRYDIAIHSIYPAMQVYCRIRTYYGCVDDRCIISCSDSEKQRRQRRAASRRSAAVVLLQRPHHRCIPIDILVFH